MIYQQTVKREITIHGIGLHSGKEAKVTIKPARPNRGIVFFRGDLEGRPEISAHYKNIVNTQLATTLGRGHASISTVEHLLAALQILGIDNVLIEVSGPEVPILDGSAQVFCEAIRQAGIESQSQPRAVLSLRRRVEVRSGEKIASVEPCSRLEILASVEWSHPSVGPQEFHYIEGKTPYSELARARTFGFLRDVEALKRMGLARGGSLDNAIVLDETSVLNPEGLRYTDEFVRHKVLDALGDLKLAGIALQGFVRLHRAGHELHSKLLCEIFRDPENYEIIDPQHQLDRFSTRIQTALARTNMAATV